MGGGNVACQLFFLNADVTISLSLKFPPCHMSNLRNRHVLCYQPLTSLSHVFIKPDVA